MQLLKKRLNDYCLFWKKPWKLKLRHFRASVPRPGPGCTKAPQWPPTPRLLSRVFVSFPVALFKFSPCSALVIKSFKHKAGSTGVFTHFPSPLSYTLITGLELLDNAESVTFYSFFFFFLATLPLGPIVHQFQAVLTLDDLYIWLFSYSFF